MLFVVYLTLCIFLLHSALLMASREIMILVIFLTATGICAFFVCLFERFNTKVLLKTVGNSLVLSAEKKGILPAANMKLRLDFTYDQTGEGSTMVTGFTLPAGKTEMAIPVRLPFAGSGTFVVAKCTVSDWFGFFSIPVKGAKGTSVPVDIYPPAMDVDLYVEGNRLTGTASDHAQTTEHKGDDPSETLEIRELRDGDPVSRIHWKLTAKRDEYMFREFARESDAQFLFVLELKERTQEHFDKVLTNYYALASRLVADEIPHAVLWADGEGDLHQEYVSEPSDLENAMVLVMHTYDEYRSGKTEKTAEMPRFSPFDGSVILEEYEERERSSSFVRKFTITADPLEELQRRWMADEE